MRRTLERVIMVGMRRAHKSFMRFLAIALSLSLLGGCVDELGEDGREASQEGLDEIDGDDTNTDGRNNLPDPRCGDTFGKGGASRKKADGGADPGCI
jgi:hypothetical protein